MLVAGGCGSQSATVSGKVSYNGKMLKGGNVTFVSTEGKPSASASIEENGTYTCKAPTGKVRISVETSSLKPTMMGGAKKYSAPAGQTSPYDTSGSTDASKRYVEIPDNYADPDKSGLTLEVKGGSQTHDIELK
jgi:hypothetical protein